LEVHGLRETLDSMKLGRAASKDASRRWQPVSLRSLGPDCNSSPVPADRIEHLLRSAGEGAWRRPGTGDGLTGLLIPGFGISRLVLTNPTSLNGPEASTDIPLSEAGDQRLNHVFDVLERWLRRQAEDG
jgi:hypothetical protein